MNSDIPNMGQHVGEDALASNPLVQSRLPYLRPWNLLDEYDSDQPLCDDAVEVQPRDDDQPLPGAALRHSSSMEPRHWWLIYTKSRQEKKVAGQLASRDVPHFLPVVERTSLSRGRTRTAQLPLFPGYLFLWGNDHERLHALQTNRICGMDKVDDGRQLRNDLRRIARLIALGAALTPEARLVDGQRVRVRAGDFVGFEGVVLKRRGKTQLLVAIEYMQTGASMVIDDYLLEPV